MLRKITLITLTLCFAALAMIAQNNWSLGKMYPIRSSEQLEYEASTVQHQKC